MRCGWGEVILPATIRPEFAQTSGVTDSPPSLALRLDAHEGRPAPTGITLALVSFNTAPHTLRCLESIAACVPAPDRVVILDNASRKEDFERLAAGCRALPHSGLELFRSATNLGFAAGSNFLMEAALADADCRHVALLNNDAVARPDLFGQLRRAMAEMPRPVGLAGGRMNRLGAPELPDTLGITVYASLMPADRLDVADPYLGPTGGCCMLSRELLDDLKATSGYWYDDRYFCYCEDTDLALRALLLGYRPAYVDEVVALHEGQASSGGTDSEFIAYHGIRNLIWMQVKLYPGRLFLKFGALLAAAHVMALVRQSLVGRFGLMLRVYRDALARLPEFRAERARFAREVRVEPADLERLIAPRFYRKGYLGEVLGIIGRRWRGRPGQAPGRSG